MAPPFLFVDTAIQAVTFDDAYARGDAVAIPTGKAADAVDRAFFGERQDGRQSRGLHAAKVLGGFLEIASRPSSGRWDTGCVTFSTTV